MIPKELIQKYYDRYALVRTDTSGESDNMALVPYFIMSVSYECYTDYVQKYNASFGEQYAKTKWTNSQNRFMLELSECYTAEEYELFLEEMQHLRELLDHDLYIMHIQGMNCFMDCLNLKEQEILSGALAANRLGLEAQVVYLKTRTNANGHYIRNRHLDGVLTWSRSFCKNFLDLRHKSDYPVSESQYNMIEMSAKALTNRIHRWINEEVI